MFKAISRRSAALATLMALGLALITTTTAAAGVNHAAIIGGRDATETYSFMASFRLSEVPNHHCGGALIAADWVVTAAHCKGLMKPGETRVRIGSLDRDKGGVVARVKRIVTHPDWSGRDSDGERKGDLELIQLDRRVNLAPIRIADSPGRVGDPSRVIGWGMTCESMARCENGSEKLQELDTVRVPDKRCVDLNSGTELCTSDRAGRAASACHGDSGGPQIRMIAGRWELIGATSRDGDDVDERMGGGAGCSTNPDGGPGVGVWTDVTHYRSWITRTIEA
ncbi:S1 family peptidase [Nonomuraea sp. CA-143628]|uniref:S1 family peptidase n=1 Tax=Nonomuraea sp. CA-143628 TaxID=3239997 RepID=UPI003D90A3C2